MPSTTEIRVEQKRKLFQIMKVEKAPPEKIKEALQDLILEIRAEMEEEDVALVEKCISKLNN